MGGSGYKPEQTAHDRLPFAAVGTHPGATLEMVNEPVSHFVGHYLGEKGVSIFAQQDRVETQPATHVMGLAGPLAAQVEPYPGTRQVGVEFKA